MKDFFLKTYQDYCKNNKISYNKDTAIKEYNIFVNHVNKLALEYFNSPYLYWRKTDESKRDN